MPGLDSYFDEHARPLSRLPCTHVMNAHQFFDMVSGEDTSLRPKYCGYLKKEILFTFYGRPAYKVTSLSNGRRNDPYLPVAFILLPEHVVGQECEPPVSIFPFDTGAFVDDRYQGAFDDRYGLDDFRLTPTQDKPQKIAGTLYASNSDYYFDKNPAAATPKATDFLVSDYLALFSDDMRADADFRSSTVEIHSTKELRLSDETVAHAILPKFLLEDESVRDYLSKLAVDYASYDDCGKLGPDAYTALLMNKVADYYRDRRYI